MNLSRVIEVKGVPLQILRLLVNNGPMRAADIVKVRSVRVSRRTISHALHELHRSNYVDQLPRGFYAVKPQYSKVKFTKINTCREMAGIPTIKSSLAQYLGRDNANRLLQKYEQFVKDKEMPARAKDTSSADQAREKVSRRRDAGFSADCQTRPRSWKAHEDNGDSPQREPEDHP